MLFLVIERNLGSEDLAIHDIRVMIKLMKKPKGMRKNRKTLEKLNLMV